jgi:hypothetical protein
MPRDEEIERRLQNWARWRLSLQAGSMGYAGVDLESAGMPRSGYDTPAAIPTHDVEASETEDAVKSLPELLWQTLVVFYVGAGSLAKKARHLDISERALHARVEQSHRLLSAHFTAKNEQARLARERLVDLMRSANKR